MMKQGKDSPAPTSPHRKVAVLGYGPEGRTRALALRDAGWEVTVAVRPGGMTWVRAVADGFRPRSAQDAVADADVVLVLVPAAEQPALYRSCIAPNLKPGSLVAFEAAAAVQSKAIEPHPQVDTVLMTQRPRMDERGQLSGPPVCLVAVYRDATGSACSRAVDISRAVFGERARTVETTTFEKETLLELSQEAHRSGGLGELISEWQRVIDSGSHEPDEACVGYYERLRALAESTTLPVRATAYAKGRTEEGEALPSSDHESGTMRHRGAA